MTEHAARVSLPTSVTSFVGRRNEVSAARQRMADSRLVTLLGPGGVGKTRLAVQIAWESRRAFRDGVCLVDLASLSDGSRVAETILGALDVRDQSARPAQDKLVDHVRDRNLLIVLDNCEHLLESCASLTTILLGSSCGLRILATSREALGVCGEHTCSVPPLSTPDPERPPPAEVLLRYESVRLLVDRARAVRADFAVTEHGGPAVAALCARLDGIPLAIELAATRLRSLSVEQIVDRLNDRFHLLTRGNRSAMPRQQTLRALIDWSYELCAPEEQVLWQRLSVFAGTFDLPAAETVCAGDPVPADRVVDLLDQLVAKSIVISESFGDHVRYRMLMTVREYGADLLESAERRRNLARRHRDHYFDRARAMAAHWCGPDQARLLADMRADHANIVAALEWSVSSAQEHTTAAAMVAALRYHWVVGGYLPDGRRWLDEIIEVVDGSAPERGEALWVASWVSLVQGDPSAADRYLEQCAALAAELGDKALAADVAHWSGLAALFNGELSSSIRLFSQAVDGHERHGKTSAVLTALFQLAATEAYAGERARARATCEKGKRVSSQHQERWSRAYVQWISGIIDWQEGHLGAARTAALDALAVQRDFKDGICAALTIELLAWVTARQRDFTSAARLFGAANAVWTEIGTSMAAFGPHLGTDSTDSAAAVRDAVGDARFRKLFNETANLTVDQAIEFALGGPAVCPAHQASSPLTRREREIADLIAAGMSNRAIAEALVISRRTVDGHLEHILAKLGFRSRAEVATWVASQSLAQATTGVTKGVIHPTTTAHPDSETDPAAKQALHHG